MKLTLKQQIFKLLKWSVAIFALMFVLRLLYGYYGGKTENSSEFVSNFFSNVTSLRKNYASEKNFKQSAPPPASALPNANFQNAQKYEKTAAITSKTSDFDNDKQRLGQFTKQYSAIVQYEKHEGNKGNRESHFSIGVNPENFDNFTTEIQKIGKITGTVITKIDKTNEYRELNAKRISLEKTLVSLNDLKSKGGQISDFVSLHDKILEIEQNLQDLGVALGDFDSENEFCTVRFSLYEGSAARKITLWSRIKVAFEWTVRNFCYLFAGFAFALVAASAFVFILDKLKVFAVIIEKFKE